MPDKELKVMQNYMLVPVFNTIILPGAEMSVTLPELSREEKDRLGAGGNRAVIVPLKNPLSRQQVTTDDFYGLGVLAEVTGMGMTAGGRVLHLRTLKKVNVLNPAMAQGVWASSCSEVDETADLTADEEKEALNELKSKTVEALKQLRGYRFNESNVEQISSVNEYGVVFGPYLIQDPAQKYALLLTDSLKERVRLLKEALEAFADSLKSQGEAQNVKNAQARDYQKLVDESGMPPEARKEVDQVLKHYREAQPNDPERSSLENYLDFMTSLKWKIDETPEVDLAKAREILNRDHYGLDKVKERILQQIAVMTLKKNQSGSILLLVGAPGTGKTSMGKSVAEALGRKYVRISLGGIRDEAEIRGHRRTYIGAMPGRIMDGIKKSGSMNPVVVLDEIDKMGESYNGDPASALLEVLDPEQNSTFTDHYMNVPYDLSNVFFICTANTTQTIPGPLLDRCEVISLSGYTPGEKLEISKRYLMPRALSDAGIDKDILTVTDDALRKIIEEYTMEAGVRGLKKQLDILCRHTAAEIVEHGTEKITVDASKLSKYLGNKRVIHDRILDRDTVGVVAGLAWTQVGGEILFIETKVVGGHGNMIITGQLGDVMKESATIAATLVKSTFVEDNLDFSDKDIHIHVPEGSVQKDGPSAGVTLFTALSSLVTGIPVDRHLAMTGEISLRGQVLPIGGLPEKLMAADRAGITTVLIPDTNVQDLEDVPKETRDHLKIIPVKTTADVLRHALHIEVPQPDKKMFKTSYQVIDGEQEQAETVTAEEHRTEEN